MTPGRDLDALVAEKVMGKILPDHKHSYDKFIEDGVWIGSYESFYDNQDVWSPSTDIAAAFEVVQKLQEQKKMFSLSSVLMRPADKVEYIVRFEWFVDGVKYMEVGNVAETVPMAISLAALKAVGCT